MEALDMETSDPLHIEKAIEKLRDNTNIEIVKGKNSRSPQGMDLFIISFRHKNQKFARDYVNTLVNLYIEENLSDKIQDSRIANKFLTEQISFFKNKLDEIDRDIINFRTEKGVFISMDEGRIVEDIDAAEEKLEELKINKMELKAKKELIKRDLEKESPYTVAVFGPGTKLTIEERIIMLQNNLNKLLVNYTDNYPEVLQVKAEIESLSEILKAGKDSHRSDHSEVEMSTLNPVYQELRKEMSKTAFEFAALETREKYLKKLIEAKKAYMKEIPVDKKNIADLEREKNSVKNIYEQLILRLGQSEVSKQMEIQDNGSTFRIVDPAILPVTPVSPNRIKIILLGIFTGFLGALGLVLLIDKMDCSVKTVQTLKTLSVPVIGIVPKIQTENEVSRKRKKNITVYTIASFYTVFIMGVFVRELIIKFFE